jgi:hypothetical protein
VGQVQSCDAEEGCAEQAVPPRILVQANPFVNQCHPFAKVQESEYRTTQGRDEYPTESRGSVAHLCGKIS